jgi:SAM-dependent methyltransferase
MFEEFSDPRLVDLYDWWNPGREDTDFYLDLATHLEASSVVDVGCGTGLLACELARRGHQVVGVDPSPAMLEVARHRPGGELVTWIEGDAGDLSESTADLALMTGHVAQIIRDETAWAKTLRSIRRALRPGGRVAFETRNPGARPWLGWTPDRSRRRIHDGDHCPIDIWFDALGVEDQLVHYDIHYRFVDSGEELVSSAALRFRSQEDVARTLVDAGFSIEEVLGNWDGGHVEDQSPELIFIAARQ